MVKFYRLPDVLDITGVSKSTLYRWISNNQFPKPVQLGQRAVGWSSTPVNQWVEDRLEKSEGKAV